MTPASPAPAGAEATAWPAMGPTAAPAKWATPARTVPEVRHEGTSMGCRGPPTSRRGGRRPEHRPEGRAASPGQCACAVAHPGSERHGGAFSPRWHKRGRVRARGTLQEPQMQSHARARGPWGCGAELRSRACAGDFPGHMARNQNDGVHCGCHGAGSPPAVPASVPG